MPIDLLLGGDNTSGDLGASIREELEEEHKQDNQTENEEKALSSVWEQANMLKSLAGGLLKTRGKLPRYNGKQALEWFSTNVLCNVLVF
jgi:hypothetical protein